MSSGNTLDEAQRIFALLCNGGEIFTPMQETFFAFPFASLRYGKNEEPDKAGTIKHASIALEGQGFAVMDSARAHKFTFNEAISFMVHCNSQEEIDYFWSKLSADRKAEQCGWLKDKLAFLGRLFPPLWTRC